MGAERPSKSCGFPLSIKFSRNLAVRWNVTVGLRPGDVPNVQALGHAKFTRITQKRKDPVFAEAPAIAPAL